MKKIFLLLLITLLGVPGRTQTQEAQQLLLNWEKLTQFKQILRDMYDGYQIIHQGYTTIKDISSGNFSLHKGFLDALLEVSPAVRKYKRIADIIQYQGLIVKQTNKAFNQFREEGSFTVTELDHIGKVYANLLRESVKNLDELFLVLTAGELRMTDDERLQAIDRIYASVEDQFSFLQDFNSSTSYLSLQRLHENADIHMSKKILGK